LVCWSEPVGVVVVRGAYEQGDGVGGWRAQLDSAPRQEYSPWKMC
jgi:hypothetical protein